MAAKVRRHWFNPCRLGSRGHLGADFSLLLYESCMPSPRLWRVDTPLIPYDRHIVRMIVVIIIISTYIHSIHNYVSVFSGGFQPHIGNKTDPSAVTLDSIIPVLMFRCLILQNVIIPYINSCYNNYCYLHT